jgi:hypothetical protein
VSARHAILRPVPVREPDRRVFCGYCGVQPAAGAAADTRVCPDCGLGLLLTADAALAPEPDAAFVVVDAGLTIRALSAGAERLFDCAETDVVDQPLENLLVTADAAEGSRGRLNALIAGTARGGLHGAEPAVAIVRPARAFGVRYRARIGPCEPGRAALLVLSPL